jgi:DNA primase
MSSDFVSFALVKKSVSIVQILDHYGITNSFKRTSDSLVGPCPIDGGSNKTCFRVSASKSCFKCFGKCKTGGNILDFVSRKEGVSIRDAALLISDWFNLKSPKTTGTKARKQ